MKTLIVLLLSAVSLRAQIPACTQITDTLYNIGPSGPVLSNGTITVQQFYTNVITGTTVVQDVAQLVITSGVFSWCAPVGTYNAIYVMRVPAPQVGSQTFERTWNVPLMTHPGLTWSSIAASYTWNELYGTWNQYFNGTSIPPITVAEIESTTGPPLLIPSSGTYCTRVVNGVSSGWLPCN